MNPVLVFTKVCECVVNVWNSAVEFRNDPGICPETQLVGPNVKTVMNCLVMVLVFYFTALFCFGFFIRKKVSVKFVRKYCKLTQ